MRALTSGMMGVVVAGEQQRRLPQPGQQRQAGPAGPGGDPLGVAGIQVPARGGHLRQDLRPARHHQHARAGGDQDQPPAAVALAERELLGKAAAPGDPEHVNGAVAELVEEAREQPRQARQPVRQARQRRASHAGTSKRTTSSEASSASTSGCSSSRLAPMPLTSSSGVRVGSPGRTATRSGWFPTTTTRMDADMPAQRSMTLDVQAGPAKRRSAGARVGVVTATGRRAAAPRGGAASRLPSSAAPAPATRTSGICRPRSAPCRRPAAPPRWPRRRA
jgi:hypothetical protein